MEENFRFRFLLQMTSIEKTNAKPKEGQNLELLTQTFFVGLDFRKGILERTSPEARNAREESLLLLKAFLKIDVCHFKRVE